MNNETTAIINDNSLAAQIDAARSSMLQHAADKGRHTLDKHQVAALLIEAGVPRSTRRIIHYMQKGPLDAIKHPGPTGDEWYADPTSIPGLIGELKQFDQQEQRKEQHAAASSDTLEKSEDIKIDAARSSTLQHAATQSENKGDRAVTEVDEGVMQHTATGYVDQLQKRLDEKDDYIGVLKDQLTSKDQQIKDYSVRLRETNSLTQGLHNLVLKLSGHQTNNTLIDAKHTDTETNINP